MRFLATLLLLLPIAASAGVSAVTKDGYVACLTEEWLDDMVSFAVAKDYDSFNAYIAGDRCIIVKAGLRVTITDAGWTKHEFAYQGIKFWIVAEGLETR